eukprot:COSAG06_NODE_3152_length_5767_cov_9.071101_6_plen_878_part_00
MPSPRLLVTELVLAIASCSAPLDAALTTAGGHAEPAASRRSTFADDCYPFSGPGHPSEDKHYAEMTGEPNQFVVAECADGYERASGSSTYICMGGIGWELRNDAAGAEELRCVAIATPAQCAGAPAPGMQPRTGQRGDTVDAVCAVGYATGTGPRSSTYLCAESGWLPQSGTIDCKQSGLPADYCQGQPHDEAGADAGVDTSRYAIVAAPPNTYVAAACAEGYMRQAGDSVYKCENGWRHQGVTMGAPVHRNDLKCASGCGALPIENTDGHCRDTEANSKCLASCRHGFSGVGDPEFRCRPDGTWEPSDFRCVIDCHPLPPAPRHTSAVNGTDCTAGKVLTAGELCGVQCDAGYEQLPEGTYTYVCESDGTLIPPDPDCQACPPDTYSTTPGETSCRACPVRCGTHGLSAQRNCSCAGKMPPSSIPDGTRKTKGDSDGGATWLVVVLVMLAVVAVATGGGFFLYKRKQQHNTAAAAPQAPLVLPQAGPGPRPDEHNVVLSYAHHAADAATRPTFYSSRYKHWYIQAVAPAGPLELGAVLSDLLRAYCMSEAIEWDGGGGGKDFLRRLQTEAMQHGGELLTKFAAQRLWTSALSLRGREFCSIINYALRDDADAMVRPVATIARAINKLCVQDVGHESFFAAQNHPPNHICYRGGGFDDTHQAFFTVEHPPKKYRQPGYLATSFSQQKANDFMQRAAASNMRVVRWLIRIDPNSLCRHANLVKRTNVPGEEEYLFPPCATPNRTPLQDLVVCWHAVVDLSLIVVAVCCTLTCLQIRSLRSSTRSGTQAQLLIRTSLGCWRRWTTRRSQRTCLWPLGRKLQWSTKLKSTKLRSSGPDWDRFWCHRGAASRAAYPECITCHEFCVDRKTCPRFARRFESP